MSKKEVAKAGNTLPAEFMQQVALDAGMGGQHATSEDMTIPFIKVAQALSPEVDERDAAYIDGLKQGMFFNTATQNTYDGLKGFLAIPVLYVREYLEWTPRDAGGGFNGKHGPEIMDKVKMDDRGGAFLPNGNEIVTTGTWYFLVYDEETKTIDQAVVSLSKTQFKKSRQLVTKLKTIQLKGPNNKTFNPPFFYNVLRVTTVPESNDQGKWFGWKFDLAGNVFDIDPSGELYDQAKVLLEAVNSGEVKAATPGSQADEPAGNGQTIDNGVGSDEEIPF